MLIIKLKVTFFYLYAGAKNWYFVLQNLLEALIIKCF